MARPEQSHILIVDDDRQIRTMLARYLGDNGLRVTSAEDGRRMAELMARFRFDVVVLDVMMPGDDGFTLCRRLRAESHVPIILLTARSDETDRVVGLELGADDYVAKPFNPRELLARIRSALRRAGMNAAPQEAAASRFRFAGWTLDASRRTLVSPAGSLVDLTTGEFDLLVALARHPQQVLSRDQLLDHVHGRSSFNIDRSIDVQISRLRRKIEADPQAPALVKTVRNGGYFFSAEVTDAAA
ncbi:two-component system OmpR family response regulator [Sphingopyxis panaciterrae]|uniref:response regulator n=1 Tax=Sphingopyxis panaciterrae TaxID=363841 RepID=UPI001420A07A|nr:response regulator [Sphingopyxis panaciterrae]NIJ39363.1 two-component system OmpR family response regulator [Sphingopyxis panaciterrae]